MHPRILAVFFLLAWTLPLNAEVSFLLSQAKTRQQALQAIEPLGGEETKVLDYLKTESGSFANLGSESQLVLLSHLSSENAEKFLGDLVAQDLWKRSSQESESLLQNAQLWHLVRKHREMGAPAVQKSQNKLQRLVNMGKLLFAGGFATTVAIAYTYSSHSRGVANNTFAGGGSLKEAALLLLGLVEYIASFPLISSRLWLGPEWENQRKTKQEDLAKEIGQHLDRLAERGISVDPALEKSARKILAPETEVARPTPTRTDDRLLKQLRKVHDSVVLAQEKINSFYKKRGQEPVEGVQGLLADDSKNLEGLPYPARTALLSRVSPDKLSTWLEDSTWATHRSELHEAKIRQAHSATMKLPGLKWETMSAGIALGLGAAALTHKMPISFGFWQVYTDHISPVLPFIPFEAAYLASGFGIGALSGAILGHVAAKLDRSLVELRETLKLAKEAEVPLSPGLVKHMARSNPYCIAVLEQLGIK